MTRALRTFLCPFCDEPTAMQAGHRWCRNKASKIPNERQPATFTYRRPPRGGRR